MRILIAFVVFLALVHGLAMADVADSAANGFTVKITVSINASPADVYSKLIKIGDWWDSSHTYSGDAHNLTIEERPGGCWCEKLPNSAGVKHMEVVFLQPGETLRLVGGLGPLQQMAIAGSMTFSLSAAASGTKLEVTYAAGGYSAQGLTGMAALINQVMTEQIIRLKSYIETGNASPKPEKK